MQSSVMPAWIEGSEHPRFAHWNDSEGAAKQTGAELTLAHKAESIRQRQVHASGDIHVNLDSSAPCWNDVIEGFCLN